MRKQSLLALELRQETSSEELDVCWGGTVLCLLDLILEHALKTEVIPVRSNINEEKKE